MRFVPLQEEEEVPGSCCLPGWGTARRQATARQEKGPHQEQVCWRLDLVFPGIKTGRNKHLLFNQPCLSVILGCAGNAQSHRGQHKPSDLCEQRFDDFNPGVLPSPASWLLLKPQGRDKVAVVQSLSHV